MKLEGYVTDKNNAPIANLKIPVCRTEYKDDPSAVWEQPHTVDTYLELDGRKSHNIVV